MKPGLMRSVRLVIPVLITALGSMLVGQSTAQTFTTLHSFGALPMGRLDGQAPLAGPFLSGATLYGTTASGGYWGSGTVFGINTDGSGFTNLHAFTGSSDGTTPQSELILSGGVLYGTAAAGGSSGNGVVFAVNTDGTGFTNLHSFTATSGSSLTNGDGAIPVGGLVLSGNTLYGTASGGGMAGNGTVFKINTDGTGFTNLHSFAAAYGPPNTNTDGLYPTSGLALAGDTLYGTAGLAGFFGYGTVFAIKTDGTGFNTLHSFDSNSPAAGVIVSGNALYGTTRGMDGGPDGTVYKANLDGSGFTILHDFTCGDGCNLTAALIVSGNTLYGTTGAGGSSGSGTIFAIHADGTGFSSLYSFTLATIQDPVSTTNIDGTFPFGRLAKAGNSLYGTAIQGGGSGWGTVFRISFTPQLTIVPFGTNVILTWPTNVAGFDYSAYSLQSTTIFGPSAIWTTNSPAPVVVNGQNTVTNPISGTQQFFRLSQ